MAWQFPPYLPYKQQAYMTTEQLIDTLVSNHSDAAIYITGLTDEQFSTSKNGKWSPGQQLEHLILCLKPISQALASAQFIEEKFGKLQRPNMDYEQVIDTYKKGLAAGGKAPERFLPQNVTPGQRTALRDELTNTLTTMQQLLAGYSEAQLDTLVLPHPFLSMLSIRELFYLMSYHPLHHMQQVHHNLQS